DHRHRPRGLHPQDRLAQACSGGRSKEACSLEARFCDGQSLERRINDCREQLARAIEIAGCNRPLTARLPRLEERFEHLVQEPALPLRIHHLFVFRFVFEPQHMLGEKLERTVQIGLERADCQGRWGGWGWWGGPEQVGWVGSVGWVDLTYPTYLTHLTSLTYLTSPTPLTYLTSPAPLTYLA